ncbi:hypothetical protein CF386_09080 [Paraphotobacterium marinum]|uniref:Short-chain dehydrogenase n=1 Tax=Paraphotobacterium marinum TaxID=1755811 RepID=A0A220VFQ7_9GAMM|nr:SDR family NAD(P)-dependent oxidoreductase [Paraphotobacterium marinum]ASK79214.1 hypothetical protein CF386_09080 [Paraphotobacterium marinum]
MNKHAVITGATRGIGKEVANFLAKRNYNLTLVSRNHETLEEIKQEICNDNPKICIHTYAIDLSNFKLASEALNQIADSIEHVDVLFNNAGTYYSGTLDLDISDFSKMIDLNVKGCFLVAQVFGRKMKMQKSGYIINVSSMAGKRALPILGGYCASKFAVVGFNSALRQELAPYNVKVTALCPSVIDTDMTKDFAIPNDQKLSVSDITNALDYLFKSGPNAVIESLDIAINL